MNHSDVRAPVTGYRTKLVRITLGNERLARMAAAFPPPHLSSEASSSFVSIGRARSTALSVDFSFVNRSVHYFLQWRPVVALAIVDHRPISWE